MNERFEDTYLKKKEEKMDVFFKKVDIPFFVRELNESPKFKIKLIFKFNSLHSHHFSDLNLIKSSNLAQISQI